MRDRLRQALKHRRRLVAVAGTTLGGLAAAWLIASFSLIAPDSSSAPAAALPEPPPQAAASAPLPTLAALSQAQPTPLPTVEASPFAGIAVPPAEPPRRSGLVHHTVKADEVLWQIAEQYRLRPETILWANDISDPDLLLVGQDLIIPPTDGVLYTVQPGD